MRSLAVVLLLTSVAGCGNGSADSAGAGASAETASPAVAEAPRAAEHAGTVAEAAHADTAPGTANTPAAAQQNVANANVANAANTGGQNVANAPPGANETRVDAHGIVVTRKADGSIHVEGADRWGAHMDITYADGHYYKHAVDVLALSVTPEQARALHDSVATIAPEALHDRTPPQPAGARAGR